MPFGFAGLWERWTPPEGEPLDTCAIITTEPNELMAEIHNRMPVILPAAAHARWLDPDFADAEALQPLLVPFPADQMSATPVSTRVNNPAVDGPDCIRALS
jgi:putative SOS response-associated peptidase YedK